MTVIKLWSNTNYSTTNPSALDEQHKANKVQIHVVGTILMLNL